STTSAASRQIDSVYRAPVLPANLLGLPSVCVPAARDTDTGLPIGVLVTGARYTESICLDAAEVVEAGSPVRTPIDPPD
ncbi:MAG TPA: amidase family protein, partial [Acidimicrobiia bacterium]|nr:amidase family protein [Acidimicrobiia bacterium]